MEIQTQMSYYQNDLQLTKKLSAKLSAADLIGFSVNRANLVKAKSIRGEPLLRKKPVSDDSEKRSEDQDERVERKPSMGVSNYIAQLRDSNQPAKINVTDFSNRLCKHRIFTIIRWVLLLLSVIGGASFGPFMLYVNAPSILEALWRMEITVILLIPFVIYEKRNDKNGEIFKSRLLFSGKMIKRLTFASIGNALWMISLLFSLQYTSVAHAYLFNSIPSLIIVIVRRVRGLESGRLGLMGIFMSLAGVAIVLVDSNFESYAFVDLSAVPFWKRLVYGDLVALVGSFFAALFFVLNGEIRDEYPLYFGIAFISMIGAVFMMILALIFQGATFGFSPHTGIFGWFLYYILVGIVTGIGYYVIYSYVAMHLDAIYVTIALYFEPAVSSIIVYLLGWQSLPATLAIFGGGMVIVGMSMVSLGQYSQKKLTFTDESDQVELDSYN